MIKIPAVGCRSEDSTLWEDNFEGDLIRVSQICITHTKTELCSLQFYYIDRQGTYHLSPLRGTDKVKNTTFKVINLDTENEFLTGLSGSYGCRYCKSVNSLTFKTNKKSYGPFGGCLTSEFYDDCYESMCGGEIPEDEKCKYFDIPLGKFELFNGFHGSSNDLGIMSIGLFMKPRPLPRPVPVVGTEITAVVPRPVPVVGTEITAVVPQPIPVVRTETRALEIIRAASSISFGN